MLAEVAVHGGIADAAQCLGLKTQTGKNHLSAIYHRVGAVSSSHALYILGWVVLPVDMRKLHREG